MGTVLTAFRRAIVLLACCMCLAACSETGPMPGEVASVNGKIITFHELEARRAILFAGRSPETDTRDDAVMQEQYRHVLREMIEELVICSYMENKDLALEPGALEQEEQRIRNDYPDGAFEEMVLEQGLSLELWREGLYRRLMVERFLAVVLRPEISIAAEEVEQYYRAHGEEFIIPEQWHFLQVLGQDKNEVTRALQFLMAGKDPAATQKEFLISMHDIRMAAELLPEDMRKELALLAPWGASKPKLVEREFRALMLLDRTQASPMDAAEISRRVEQALAEEKMLSIYAAWMHKRLQKSDIRIAPALTGTLPLPSAAEAESGNEKEGQESPLAPERSAPDGE